jgi:hypothetical protein
MFRRNLGIAGINDLFSLSFVKLTFGVGIHICFGSPSQPFAVGLRQFYTDR